MAFKKPALTLSRIHYRASFMLLAYVGLFMSGLCMCHLTNRNTLLLKDVSLLLVVFNLASHRNVCCGQSYILFLSTIFLTVFKILEMSFCPLMTNFVPRSHYVLHLTLSYAVGDLGTRIADLISHWPTASFVFWIWHNMSNKTKHVINVMPTPTPTPSVSSRHKRLPDNKRRRI